MKSNQFEDYNQHKYNRMFWSWLVVYDIAIIVEIMFLRSKSFQEGKILMFLASLPLLIVGSIFYFNILATNIRSKKLDKLKLLLYCIAVLLFVIFFISIRENSSIVTRY